MLTVTRSRRLASAFALAVLLSLGGLMPTQGGTPTATVLAPTGGLHPPTDIRFLSDLLAVKAFRLAECPLTRGATYYISQAGNDANTGRAPVQGAGTSGPWKTLAKAAAALADNTLTPPAGGVAFDFRSGDVWNEVQTVTYPLTAATAAAPSSVSVGVGPGNAGNQAFPVGSTVTLSGGPGADSAPIPVTSWSAGPGNIGLAASAAAAGYTTLKVTQPVQLYVNKPHIALTSYNDMTGLPSLGKPQFTAFVPYSRAGWTVSSVSPQVYQRSEPATLGFVREQNNWTTPYVQAGSIAQTVQFAGCWYQDRTVSPSVLYVHPRQSGSLVQGVNSQDGGYDTGLVIESAPVNGVQAICVGNVDDVRIDGLRADGYTASLSTDILSLYVMQNEQTGANAALLTNDECYYGSNHVMGHTATSGGITSMINCRAGWDATGDTTFVDYAGNGANEGLYDSNVCVGTVAPISTTANGPVVQVGNNPGACFQAHTSSLSIPNGLFLLVNNSNVPGPYQSGRGWCVCNTTPAWTDPVNCKFFDVGERFYASAPGRDDRNVVTLPLVSASQTATSVTLAAPVPNSLQAPGGRLWATLSGGSSLPEQVYVGSTGGATVSTFTTIVGTGRTSITYDAGLYASPAFVAGYLAPSANSVILNSRLEVKSYFSPQTSMPFLVDAPHVGNCLYVNDTFDIDYRGTAYPVYDYQPVESVIIQGGTGSPASEFDNCRFNVRATTHTQFGLYDQAVTATTPTASALVFKNSIISGEGSGVGTSDLFVPGIGNLAANQINNAYVGAGVKTGVGGYNNDPYFLELPAGLALDARPDGPSSPLYSANPQLIFGRPLQFDADGKPRGLSIQARGPFEATVTPKIPATIRTPSRSR